ncbi:type II toxin-antitoxin system RelE/ParE family toxin [Moraxella bovis]|uniref:Putative addiction module killer protein n=1 Tax=Moraxella bovis TaxID=476 RepID=A0A378PS56_MORBO|nr:type II toxin-antitoxin system RelE/ParE family toxin [Moraxella bovis]UYZ69068.1 type II toxin-antitoxin system RelE/ParE family toxin [Moraxella bovis]UYZ71442.1 type II toxin-antitoxin system RelE/ParE family toxin [Moraxella bovis]UYZ72645.1 type II toxin-antitoxin system RelE/ParE family toxin [Moraxella bovis]UYZ88836.1 type II toxin-antitoxin system RelE/ParE family toxin [Moraxella bovis]UZA14736.1 type II toxin-antitoxin system RelE/ParE family toxin [Moraxella bovis]
MSDTPLTPYQVVSTPVFDRSLSKLRNRRVKMQITERLFRIENEEFFGDINSVGGGICKLRFHDGAGYRVCYVIRDNVVVVLLCGGDKDGQQDDIKKVKLLSSEIDNENE